MTGRTAVIVGGTGPTGPAVVAGLQARGYEVAILHRGFHEVPELAAIEHLHADPHFEESLRDVLKDRTFDLVVAQYGRTRVVADVFAGRCAAFIGVGGLTLYEGNAIPTERHPTGMRTLADEDSPVAHTDAAAGPTAKYVQKMIQTERTVFDLHRAGAFSATWLRYAMVYGARTLVPWDWSVVKRVLDGRDYIILPDAGLSLRARLAVDNAAAFVLAAVDNPTAAAGQIFNCADETQFSLRQWTEIVARAAGRDLRIVSLPWAMALPAVPLFPYKGTGSHHTLVSIDKARRLLGYRDQVDPEQAIRASARWYVENPVTPENYPNLADRFDYAWEDALVAAYTKALAEMAPLLTVPETGVMHDYPHPKVPGERDDHGR